MYLFFFYHNGINIICAGSGYFYIDFKITPLLPVTPVQIHTYY